MKGSSGGVEARPDLAKDAKCCKHLSFEDILYLDVWKTSTSLSSSLSDWLSSDSFWPPGFPLKPLLDPNRSSLVVSTEAAFLTTCKVMPVMQMTRPSMFITEMSEDWNITASVREIISFTMPEQKNYCRILNGFNLRR